MSQKVICLHGHAWDPTIFTSGPAAETTSRCPICGEPARGRAPSLPGDAVHFADRALAPSPPDGADAPSGRRRISPMVVICGLLGLGLILMANGWWRASRSARDAAEQAHLLAQREQETRRPRGQEADAGSATLRRMRQAEMDVAKWKEKHDEIKAELSQEKRRSKEAVRQRDEQAHDRKLAEDLARIAEQVRQEAVSRREKAARQLVRMHVALGTRRMDGGDLSASLLWFAEALRLAHGEKLPEETHRLRLASVLALCPRPVQVWLHEKKVNVVRLSPDGRRVLTAGADGAAVVWDAVTGRRIGEPLQHGAAVSLASFSPDGQRVLTAATDMTVHVWDLGTGSEVFPELQLMGPVFGLSFRPDGRRFLTVAAKSAMNPTEAELHIWDAATGEAVGEEALGSEISPLPAAFSPDGKQVLTICQDRCARVWDIATEKQAGAAFAHTAAVTQASFSPDGRRVLTASTDGTARVWRVSTGEPLTPPLKHGSAVRRAVFSRSGHYALTASEDRGVRIWDTSNGEGVGQPLRHPDTVDRAVFSPDDRYVLTTCADGAARVWDCLSGEEVLPALQHGGSILYAAFTPAGDGVLTLSGRVVRIWDLTAGEPPPPPVARTPTGLTVFSPNGRRVLRVMDTTAQVYDTEKDRAIGAALPHKNKVTAAAFSADGRRVLTVQHQANGDELEGHVYVWETETGKPVGEPLVHPRSVLQAKLSADGGRVLTACQDRKARLWDMDKSARIGQPMEHKEDLGSSALHPGRQPDSDGGCRRRDAVVERGQGRGGRRDLGPSPSSQPPGVQLRWPPPRERQRGRHGSRLGVRYRAYDLRDDRARHPGSVCRVHPGRQANRDGERRPLGAGVGRRHR